MVQRYRTYEVNKASAWPREESRVACLGSKLCLCYDSSGLVFFTAVPFCPAFQPRSYAWAKLNVFHPLLLLVCHSTHYVRSRDGTTIVI
jgi:hypothetical protein